MTHEKKVLIDCDGVVCDFMGHVVDFANKSGKTSRQWKYEEITGDARKYPLWTESGLEEEWLREGFCSELPIIPGSQEFVEALRRDGFEILFVTSPPRDGKFWTFERKNWLEKNFGAKRGEVIFATDKRYVSGLTLIDDHVDNCMEWNAYNQHHGDHLHSIMVAQPWNQKAADYKHRTNNFDDMIDLIHGIHSTEKTQKMFRRALKNAANNVLDEISGDKIIRNEYLLTPQRPLEEIMQDMSVAAKKIQDKIANSPNPNEAFILPPLMPIENTGGRRHKDPRRR
jgi:hypothetical protein